LERRFYWEIIISKNYTEHRPWGAFTILLDENGYKVKRLTVKPGHCTSLQFHKHRSEHWVVVQGTATVILEKETKTVSKNEYIHIPLGSQHLLENKGEIVMQLIEVQIGDYLEEDDIVRLQDKYGRI
jgi:mannose-6-phosphate isomerase-like protein (cupin superfamily)